MSEANEIFDLTFEQNDEQTIECFQSFSPIIVSLNIIRVTDGRTDRQTDGRTDGRANKESNIGRNII